MSEEQSLRWRFDVSTFRLIGRDLITDRITALFELVKNCNRNCAFIVTERHDMKRRPWIPIKWILKNRWRVKHGKPICWD